jgi:hypothetical protein
LAPCSSSAMKAAVARQCVEATMPTVPDCCGCVVMLACPNRPAAGGRA